jgi:ubiquinone biosynthesis accessory factor UbiJ
MPATPAWLAAVEALLNRSMASSMQAAAIARRLNGTSLQIDVGSRLRIRAAMSDGRLALMAGGDASADASVAGSPWSLLALLGSRPLGAGARGTHGAGAMIGGDRGAVQIRGDAEIANRYRELIAVARPDLEEELSRLIGDMPARRVSQAAHAALSWARHAGRTAGENLAEYLQEESRDVVSKPELEEFLLGVDQLRETADRIEARLGELERRLKGMA